MLKLLNISYDGFIRTTDEDHCKTVEKIFQNYMIKEIFIKVAMKDYIVLLVNHFS